MVYYSACFAEGALTEREKALIAEEMTEAVHVACAIRGGAALVHGVQMRNFVSPGMTTSFRECLVGGRERTVEEAWTSIAELVFSAGLVLGTSFRIESDADSA